MEAVYPKVSVPLRMKSKYLEPAQQRVPNPELLINLVSRRVRQLAQGHRPLTETDPRMDFSEIALKEISEGKLAYELAGEGEEIPLPEPPPPPSAPTE
jgi:DNA-directed RNA polymerase subunit omega